MLLRKAQPGSDSYGHTWTTDKSVVEVTDEQGAELLAIRDAGFTVVNRPEPEDPEDEDEDAAVTEVDPRHDDASPAPRKAARPGRRRAGDSE